MATDSLNHFSSLVNQQMGSIETIHDQLSKANALLQIALHGSFLHYPKSLIHNYLLTISDLLDSAYQQSQQSLVEFEENYQKPEPCMTVKMQAEVSK
ncbi:MAG: hypothetical protein QM752_07095 [Gammaproteobacteria bacterium]